MKTLEGQAAINYLDRLTSVVSCGSRYSQSHLLYYLLTLEKLYFCSQKPNNEIPNIIVGASGFPSLTPTLAHADQAIKIHTKEVNLKRKLAAKFLEATKNLGSGQVATINTELAPHIGRNSSISHMVSDLSDRGLSYLQSLCQQDKPLPIYPHPARQSVILEKVENTPLTGADDDTAKSLRLIRYFHKYLDAPLATIAEPLGTKDQPIDPNNLPSHPRLAAMVYGRYDQSKDKFDEVSVNTATISAYVQKTKTSEKKKKKKVVEKTEIPSGTKIQLDKVFRANSPVVNALLNIDFANLSDNTIDAMVEILPQIHSQINTLIDLTQRLTKNENMDPPSLLKSATDLIDLIRKIENTEVQTAIHLSLAKRLNQIIDEISHP